MILGLDISTSITGITILDEKGEIILCEAIDTRNKNHFPTIFHKAQRVKDYLYDIRTEYSICSIYIEQPFTFFNSGGSSAKTMAALQKFNGIVSWMTYELFGIKPEYIGATHARKLCGIKVHRGQKAKKVVLEHLLETEKTFKIEYTSHGNPKPESYDRADAIVIAKAGYEILQKKLDE
jgi:Holliday junction resolvasome RuvABC endonuclease subunit